MKIILIGANGTIGEQVQKALAGAGHEIVKAGGKSGDFQVEIESRESVRKLYQDVGSFDAVSIAAGEVAFAPFSEFIAEKWQFSLGSKLMGQINPVQEATPFINEKGSFTLVSGIGPFFPGVIPVEGWKVGQAYNALSWGRKPAAFTKLIELIHRLFEAPRLHHKNPG